MADLIPSGGAAFARVMTERGGDIALPPIDLGLYPPPLLEQARRVWQERVSSEYRSVQIMTRFCSELAGAGEPPDVLMCAVDMIEDEVKHAASCAAMVRALGGVPKLPEPLVLREPEPFLKAPMLERALHTAITMLAINETISVAFVEDLRDRCRGPAARAVLDATLADEEGHQDLGWAFVARGLRRYGKSTLPEWRHLVELTLKPHREAYGRILDELPQGQRSRDAHLDHDCIELGLFGRARQALVGQAALDERVLPRLRELELA